MRLPSLTSYISASFRRLRTRPGFFALLSFLIVYVAFIRYCRLNFYRDPTSAFFDPERGYERLYSAKRQQDAEDFVINANRTDFGRGRPRDIRTCVGIATVGRDEDQYVRATIGSLLEGLSPAEREEIYLMVLIAHTSPEEHPIYGEKWLTDVVDKVLLYDVGQKRKDELRGWESEKDYRKKAVFDYTYLLQKCSDIQPLWIVMIEDDTLAVRGWYSRALAALEKADEQHPRTQDQDWLYMRLFYTEEFLGWNIEEWPRYAIGSVAVTGMTFMFLILLRQCLSSTTLTNTHILITTAICTPLCILLYFLAGRISMQPFTSGVYQMPKFGCCAQGMVFSHKMAPKVIGRLSAKREGFVDELIESWANEQGLTRWVVVPSLLQHVGAHSSKGDDYGEKAKYERSVAEKIWNFGFELYGNDLT
ncbi:hypothetical protein MMC21_004355 [Puttea exsequens]|nr:hypothetical protein [Puttea exsequens]